MDFPNVTFKRAYLTDAFNSPAIQAAILETKEQFSSYTQSVDQLTQDIRAVEKHIRIAGITIPFEVACDKTKPPTNERFFILWDKNGDGENKQWSLLCRTESWLFEERSWLHHETKRLDEVRLERRLELVGYLPGFLKSLGKHIAALTFPVSEIANAQFEEELEHHAPDNTSDNYTIDVSNDENLV